MAVKRKQAYIARLLIGIILINTVLVAWFFFISLPLWQIKTVQVVNNSYLPTPRILEKLVLPKDTSIWRVSNNTVRKLFKDDPWVKQIVVRRRLPNTLVLDTVVRQPYFKLLIGERIWYIDEEGKILNHDGIAPTGLSCYTVVGVSSIADIAEVVSVLVPLTKQYKDMLDQENVRIDFSNKNDIRFFFDLMQVKIGDSTNMAEKREALQYVLGALGERIRRVSYIDVRAYKTPAVRFR